jgi:general secretion pathway protein D
MVFLRPHVLRDAGSADALTGERYDFIRQRQAEFQMRPHFALPDMRMEPLPELKNPPLPELLNQPPQPAQNTPLTAP